MPARINLTVPPGFRKRLPKGIIIHRARLSSKDIEERAGYQVTVPLKTLLDVAEGTLGEELLQQALKESLGRGLVMMKQIDLTKMTERGKSRMQRAIHSLPEHSR